MINKEESHRKLPKIFDGKNMQLTKKRLTR